MVLQRRLKKKMTKTLVFFLKFAKCLITMQKNVGTKASLNVTFEKCIGHVEKDCLQKIWDQANFCKKMRKKGKKMFSLLLNLMLQQKAMNSMLIVVVVIT